MDSKGDFNGNFWEDFKQDMEGDLWVELDSIFYKDLTLENGNPQMQKDDLWIILSSGLAQPDTTNIIVKPCPQTPNPQTR